MVSIMLLCYLFIIECEIYARKSSSRIGWKTWKWRKSKEKFYGFSSHEGVFVCVWGSAKRDEEKLQKSDCIISSIFIENSIQSLSLSKFTKTIFFVELCDMCLTENVCCWGFFVVLWFPFDVYQRFFLWLNFFFKEWKLWF